MSLPSTADAQGLELAFRTFTEISRRMESSYRELEGRVRTLNRELAVARSERLRQLRENEALGRRLAGLLRALPDGVLVLDAHGRIAEANPAARELLGVELERRPWDEVLAQVSLATGASGREIRLRNGRTVSLSGSGLADEPGRIVVVHDVTETAELRSLVSRQEGLAALGEMAAKLAHQVRTPLAAATLYASHLRGEKLDEARRLRIGEKIARSLRELEGQVNDMLLFSRGASLELEPIDLGELLAELREAMEPHRSAHGAALRIGLDGGASPRLGGNREALKGALGNLIINSLQAGAARIELDACAEPDGALRIAVSDDGAGVPEALRGRIFEPFFTSRAQGTGLGLAVARGVIEAHGGSLECASEVGAGACFRIRIPADARPGALPSSSSGGAQLARGTAHSS